MYIIIIHQQSTIIATRKHCVSIGARKLKKETTRSTDPSPDAHRPRGQK